MQNKFISDTVTTQSGNIYAIERKYVGKQSFQKQLELFLGRLQEELLKEDLMQNIA